MNNTRTSTKRRIKNIALAACAVMATATMAAGDLAAQCRIGGGNPGYGYGGNNSGNGFSRSNSSFGNSYTNGRGYGASSYNDRYSNSRSYSGYNQGYGVSGSRGLSSQRPSLSIGLTYNGSRNSNRSGLGSGFYTNSRQPVSYRNGDRFGSGYGQSRSPLNRAGY